MYNRALSCRGSHQVATQNVVSIYFVLLGGIAMTGSFRSVAAAMLLVVAFPLACDDEEKQRRELEAKANQELDRAAMRLKCIRICSNNLVECKPASELRVQERNCLDEGKRALEGAGNFERVLAKCKRLQRKARTATASCEAARKSCRTSCEQADGKHEPATYTPSTAAPSAPPASSSPPDAGKDRAGKDRAKCCAALAARAKSAAPQHRGAYFIAAAACSAGTRFMHPIGTRPLKECRSHMLPPK